MIPVLSPADARRILGQKADGLSDDELGRRLALLSAIAAEIEKAYNASRRTQREKAGCCR